VANVPQRYHYSIITLNKIDVPSTIFFYQVCEETFNVQRQCEFKPPGIKKRVVHEFEADMKLYEVMVSLALDINVTAFRSNQACTKNI